MAIIIKNIHNIVKMPKLILKHKLIMKIKMSENEGMHIINMRIKAILHSSSIACLFLCIIFICKPRNIRIIMLDIIFATMHYQLIKENGTQIKGVLTFARSDEQG